MNSCTPAQQKSVIYPAGSPLIHPDTTFSSTNIHMRETTSSLWVSHSIPYTYLIDYSYANYSCPPLSLSIVFIYSMPGYSCSIKERMLYSSCKSRLLEEVERDFHLEVAKKVKTHFVTRFSPSMRVTSPEIH